MKKLFFTILILVSVTLYIVPFSQNYETIDDSMNESDSCVETLFEALFGCFSDLDVSATIVDVGNQFHVFLTYNSSEPEIRGRIQNCVADYNSSRNVCDDAPVMVIKK